ncbi:MAG TPA: hypothetical protein PLL69_00965 [Gemmatimonadales bacterium]|nr:hypothetical protein [Gemmatimonadales bacterium]
MHIRLVLLILLLTPATSSAQLFVRLGGGITGSTPFSRDFIVEPFTARQSTAPSLNAVVGWQLSGDYRIGAELRYAMGNWEVDDRDFVDDLGSLRTMTLGLFADGPLSGPFRWEAAVGTLRYQAEREVGVFSQGGGTPWIVGGGAAWHRQFGNRLALVASARYDFHGFNTPRLDAEGYASNQSVHRLGLIIALERGF